MRRLISLVLAVLATANALDAQNVSDLIISEVMLQGEGAVTDAFGRQAGWVEVFNNSYGTVNIGGCYFTDNRDNLTKSPVSGKDSRTKIGPRQTVIFHEAADSPSAFHLNFAVRPGTTLILVSNNGRDIIDEFDIPADIPEGKSASRVSHDSKGMIFGAPAIGRPSPMSVETELNSQSQSEEMGRKDPYGFVLSIVCIMVVFSALIILFLVYGLMGNIITGKYRRKQDGGLDEEEAAAVALALEMYLNGNGNGDRAITIRRQQTAWNDKHQTFRKRPSK